MYELRSYASPKATLTQMIKKREIIRIARGVYADSPQIPAPGRCYALLALLRLLETALDGTA